MLKGGTIMKEEHVVFLYVRGKKIKVTMKQYNLLTQTQPVNQGNKI